MTDVVEIARERQSRLAAEIGRLDNFISMAEALVNQSRSGANMASDPEDEEVTEFTGPTTLHPSSAAAGGIGAKSDTLELVRPQTESRGTGA
jgi:hypothetical protein